MGLFFRKVLGEESVLVSALTTFGQSIDSVERANNLSVPKAWDLFINKVGFLVDEGFISEQAMDTTVHSSNFKVGRSLVLDLVKLRDHGKEVSNFYKNVNSSFEHQFPLGSIVGSTPESPKLFADFLVSVSKKAYPNFGASEQDQKFYAIIGIYFAAVYSDSNEDKGSQKVYRRGTAITLGLQWFAEWNIAKKL